MLQNLFFSDQKATSVKNLNRIYQAKIFEKFDFYILKNFELRKKYDRKILISLTQFLDKSENIWEIFRIV